MNIEECHKFGDLRTINDIKVGVVRANGESVEYGVALVPCDLFSNGIN